MCPTSSLPNAEACARGSWRDGRKQKIFFPDDLEVGTAELQPAYFSCLRLLQAIDTA